MRHKTGTLFTIIFASIAILFLTGCEQAPVTIIQPVQVGSVSASIKGNLDLPESGKVSASEVWIKVSHDGETKNISKANADGSFVIPGLLEGREYDILFTTEKPATANERDISRGENSTTGYGGWLSNVTAAINEGNNVGAVTISPLGTIKGKVTLDGETEHYDILVYIPGTSFSAYTNADGDFYMYNVPEGTYNLRITYLKSGFGSILSEDVTVRGYKTNKEEHPIVQMDDIVLYRDLGVIEGKVLLDTDESPLGIMVMVKTEDGSRTYTSSTDDSGSYHIDDVKPGSYTLYASKSGFDSVTVEEVVVVPAATKIVPIQTLSSGVRYVTGKVSMEAKTDHSGALITATNTKETNLIYSAISNTDGDYSLVNMKPGQYRVVITANNYNTVTSGVISVLTDSVVNLGTTQMTIIRGTIMGSAVLEGRGTNAGIKAELMKGTDVYATTYTDDSGLYAFSVPQGNYSGVRLTCENFKSVSIAQSIALIANDYVTIGEEGTVTEMEATHVPVVRGRLTVKNLLSLDYSGITVTFVENGMTTTTDHDGYWSFTKVPVGHYTLKFERENTNPVTMAVDIVASAEKNIETIELIPNAASIEGNVTLNGLTDYSGITVRATAEGMAELSTKTNAAGYFYIGNVVTTETYTVHFEKAGWISQTREISGLADLSINDITEGNPIKLLDTTAPVLNSISVTVGNSELEGRKLNVYINAVEEGSGLAKVYVNTTNDFTNVEPINYATPLACYVEDTEGNFTLYVKVEDKSGNQSTVSSQAFSIADYKTVVSSVILDNEDGVNDGIVTWTKAKSPYYVTGNILVDENTTLIIEPGVNVQFSGAYFIQVEGTLKINGTENEKVYLYGVGSGENKWTGINGVKESGNEIHFAVLTGMAQGVKGYVRVADSTLTAGSGGFALGDNGTKAFTGTIENSSITGKLYTSYATLLRNHIESTYDAYSNYYYESYSIQYSSLSGNELEGLGFYILVSSGENNLFDSTKVYMRYSGMVNGSFRNSTVSMEEGGLYSRCVFEDCTFVKFLPAIVKNSNIIDCGTITVTSNRTDYEKLDLTGNYWGVNNTAELNAHGVNYNHSFLVDYYDDFNVTVLDVSGYATTAYEGIGYLGDAYYPETIESTTVYTIGSTGPAGGVVFYDKGYYSEGWRYLEAAPTDLKKSINSTDYNSEYDDENFYITFGYYRATDNSYYQRTGTGTFIGSGRINTQMLVETMGNTAYTSYDKDGQKTATYAAKLCYDYVLNGYDDWFLPSRDELNLMYVNLHKAGLGGFANDSNYWSSSESRDHSDYAWSQYFDNGNQNYYRYRGGYTRVRPVRAF